MDVKRDGALSLSQRLMVRLPNARVHGSSKAPVAVAVMVLVASVGCGPLPASSAGEFVDAAFGADASDAATADAGRAIDGGATDGAVIDGGVEDGGVEDGGVEDGGVEDGGVEDGGVEDGGVEDGGAIDSGGEDGGPSDVACARSAMAEGAACDDGDPTTQGDVCSLGVCRPGAGRALCLGHEDVRSSAPQLITDASSYGYAYAPTMTWSDGAYRSWYCSSGTGVGDWDHVRYSTSLDLGTWTSQLDLVRSTDPDVERAACDPSVVRFSGYWYLFYSGNQTDVQTVHFVARSTATTGPFAKYTRRGTFEVNASDPAVIRSPIHPTPDGANWYGTGQASVINRNDVLYIWFTDTTATYPNAAANRIYFARTTDPTVWPTPVDTGVNAASIDVLWDEARQHFEMTSLGSGHTGDAHVERYYSRDGESFAGPFPGENAPNFSHNPGVLRDPRGHRLHAGVDFVAYGAPRGLANDVSWAAWDLYAHRRVEPVVVTGDFDGDGKTDVGVVDTVHGRWFIRSSQTGQEGVPGVPWGWSWAGQGAHHLLALGDYDGDGKTDRAIIDPNVEGGAAWYVISSASGEPGVSDIPWGWQWTAMTRDHVLALGDYDGDGKTDRAIVDLDAQGGAAWFVVSSATGSLGVPNISWGWQWAGMGRRHTLALGDYDGDGKTDQAIVDLESPSGATWFVRASSTGQPPADIAWGDTWSGFDHGYALALGDYDGDGRTERALVASASRGSGWFFDPGLTSPAPFERGWVWPSLGDHHQIVVGDFDGDGRADRTVVDPDISGCGVRFYSLPSSGQSTSLPWGLAIEVPYQQP
ncbi:MAG: hypothetical protein H6729_04865 [Deltaproteobacteria bacterium]|nr:hypothetical protein [Deltaproteobacteria bacterium]